MKKTTLFTATMMVSGAFALAACGGGDKKPADQPKTDAPKAEAPVPAINTVQKIKDKGTVVIGHRESSIPHSYLLDGKAVGYSMDVCAAIVETLKKAPQDTHGWKNENRQGQTPHDSDEVFAAPAPSRH